MSIFNRSFLYVKRHKKKSILMILLMVFMISILHISLDFQPSQSSIPYEKSFTYTTNTTISLEKAKQIAKLEKDMIANYTTETYVSDTTNQMLQSIATNDTSYTQDFLLKNQKLVQGRHIQEDDKHKAMVHEQYAKEHNLSLGSQFLDKYEIVGIFSGVKQNQVYTSLDDEEMTSVTYYYKDANTFQKAQEIVSSSELKQNDILTQIEESTSQMQSMIQIFLSIMICVCIVILTCILIFWIQERKYEIAILLSIGISKCSIFFQMLLEMFYLFIISCCIEIVIFTICTLHLCVNFNAICILLLCITLSIIFATFRILIQKPKHLFTNLN